MIRGRHVVASLGVFLCGVSAGSVFSNKKKQCDHHGCKFDALAPDYDAKIDFSERLAGITTIREKLFRDIKGKTLEVAAGTGRNLKFYPKNSDLTLNDVSSNMLDVARSKTWECNQHNMRFSCGDSETLPFDDNEFDNVIDTFGLCSVKNPQAMLNEMVRVCRKGGQIRLVEHGRSEYSLLNRYLDARVASHIADWGCHWNRDMKEYVNQLDTKAVELIQEERHHFGTTYEFVLTKI